MTTKQTTQVKAMTLAELTKRAATPRGKRNPLGADLILHNKVVYLQHAARQAVEGLNSLPLDPQVETVKRWLETVGGIDEVEPESATQRIDEMVTQLSQGREVTFDESDVQDVYDSLIAVLGDYLGEVKVEARQDIDDPQVAELQWYFKPAEVEQVDEPEVMDGEQVGEPTDDPPVATEDSPIEPDGEAEGKVESPAPADDTEWAAPWIGFDGYETIRLGGVEYRRDPVSAVYPDLPEEEIAMLAESLKQNGQKVSVKVYRPTGTVPDGWQRLIAMQQIEMHPWVEVLRTEDIPEGLSAYVLAVNEHRRGSTNPTATQRVLQAIQLDDADRTRGDKAGRAASAKKLAAAAGCSTGVVDHVRRALKYDKANGTDYEGKMLSGKLSSRAAVDAIVAAEEQAKQDDPPAGGEAEQPQPKPTGVEYDSSGNKRSRRDLVDMLTGAEEDAQVAAEEHAQAIAGEREKVAQARKEAQQAREKLQQLTDADESAKQVVSLDEQNAALKSQVAVLTERVAELERERDGLKERIEQAGEALVDGEQADLYEALGIDPPVSADDDDPFC